MKTPALLSTLALATRLFAADAVLPPPIPEEYKGVQAELLVILEDDKAPRLKIEPMMKDHDFNSPEVQELLKDMAARDAINVGKVTAILDQYGWLGPEQVGPMASVALFLVIQHANLATQQKYLPMLREAVKAQKAAAGNLALLEDRLALRTGHRQIYGSQLASDSRDKKLHVSPIEDPEHVDERRAAVGLPPMAEYLKHWNLTWDVEEHKKLIPWLEEIKRTPAPPPK